MTWLSLGTEAILEKHVEKSLIQSITDSCIELKSRRTESAPYPNPTKLSNFNRANSNCIVMQQSLLHRMEKLTLSLGDMLLHSNVYGLALLIRAHYESAALLGYFCYRLNSLKCGYISFDDFQHDLARVMISSKHDHFKEAPLPQNILKCIDRTDKYLSGELGFKTSNIVADNHGWLSEFCHPNFLSMSSSLLVDKENEQIVFRHGAKMLEREAQLLGYSDISLKLFVLLFDAFDEMRLDRFAQKL
ncbi:hypothetical protein [Parasphingorhabdus halotolerans]|uniref:Uncharacterized protein n=1 Tax=Parasphingorhabdus halotolerans TaxID=2725558 RepID=A0A6H2DP05_9SPHN|nr:hypothetical protein [Parasphingorhabdus halotolerans]QJB69713.1 hypothetical protein HF685_10840 [Parasphingorhabdus halotolerans]